MKCLSISTSFGRKTFGRPTLDRHKIDFSTKWLGHSWVEQTGWLSVGQMSIGQMSVGQMPVGQMPVSLTSVSLMSVGLMCLGQMSVGLMSGGQIVLTKWRGSSSAQKVIHTCWKHKKCYKCEWVNQRQGILKGKYHCTVDLLFDCFELVCFANKTKNQLSYRWIQTSQTGGQWYNETFPFSIPCQRFGRA